MSFSEELRSLAVARSLLLGSRGAASVPQLSLGERFALRGYTGAAIGPGP